MPNEQNTFQNAKAKFIESISNHPSLNEYWYTSSKSSYYPSLLENNQQYNHLARIDTPWYKLSSTRKGLILSLIVKIIAIVLMASYAPIFKSDPFNGVLLSLSTAGVLFNLSLSFDFLSIAKHKIYKTHREFITNKNNYLEKSVLNLFNLAHVARYNSESVLITGLLNVQNRISLFTTRGFTFNKKNLYSYKRKHNLASSIISFLLSSAILSMSIIELNNKVNFLSVAGLFLAGFNLIIPCSINAYNGYKNSNRFKSCKDEYNKAYINEITYALNNNLKCDIEIILMYGDYKAKNLLNAKIIEYVLSINQKGENIINLVKDENHILNYLYQNKQVKDAFRGFPSYSSIFENNINNNYQIKFNTRRNVFEFKKIYSTNHLKTIDNTSTLGANCSSSTRKPIIFRENLKSLKIPTPQKLIQKRRNAKAVNI